VAQGYHLSRPLPAEAFDRWYTESRTLHGVA
jgi:EAL domain-containing protein (putative c-di-GMP-specific phosphodiesterase class I)